MRHCSPVTRRAAAVTGPVADEWACSDTHPPARQRVTVDAVRAAPMWVLCVYAIPFRFPMFSALPAPDVAGAARRERRGRRSEAAS
ncbi:MAG: hypothetical protein ACT4O0_00370 [Pseudonocardia sp.]